MSVYLVTYQLNSPGQEYQDLYDAIEAYDHINPINSVYFIDAEPGAPEVKDELKQYIDSNDSLIVIEVNSHWGMTGVSSDHGDWIRDRI
jgi:hypothetical protein